MHLHVSCVFLSERIYIYIWLFCLCGWDQGLLKQAFGYPQLPDPLSLSARPQTRELTCQPPSESKIWALWRHVDWRMSACETTLHPEAMAVQSNVWVHKCCRPDDKKRHGRPANTQADAIRHRIEPQTLYNALSWLEVGQCQSSREKGQGRQKEPTKCGLIWHSTSILGSWNSHGSEWIWRRRPSNKRIGSSAKQLLTTHAWRTRVIKIVWKMVETFLEPITRPLCHCI